MGILTKLKTFARVNFRSYGSRDEKRMIDNIVFAYKYMKMQHTKAFTNETGLVIFLIGFTLEHLENESINRDFLLDVVRRIEKDTEDSEDMPAYKLYQIVYKTMYIYYQNIFYSKDIDNFQDRAQEKLEILNWYIARKILEYESPVSVNTPEEKEIVANLKKALVERKLNFK